MATVINGSNGWRWTYPRPAEVRSPGVDAARVMRQVVEAHAKPSRQRQLELRKSTGFAGDRADVGHAVEWELGRRGYRPTVARFAGALVATAEQWNFQGMRRLAFWQRMSIRTLRRARAELEADGLLRSHLLLPGDQVLGQRAPVLRPQVVRDVRPLVALIAERVNARRGTMHDRERRRRASPSGSGRAVPNYSVYQPPAPPPAPMSAEDFQEVAQRAAPEFAGYAAAIAAARRGPPAPPSRRRDTIPPPPFTPEELDAFDAETERMERELRERREREQRGPPS